MAWQVHIALVSNKIKCFCTCRLNYGEDRYSQTQTQMYIVSTNIYPQTDTLVHDENKETLALLTPPPITHAASTPSSQLSQLQKLYKYTRTLSHIHTHPHTPFSLLTPFPARHGSLQLVLVCPLAAAACTQCVCVFMCVYIRVTLSFIAVVPAELRHVVPTSGPSAWERKWTVSHVLFWPPLSCEILQPPRTQSVLHLRAGRGLKCQWEIKARLAVDLCFFSASAHFTQCFNSILRNESHNQRVKSLLCLLCMFRCVSASQCALNTECFLFDTMCEVINLIATATEYSVTAMLAGSFPDLRGFMARGLG